MIFNINIIIKINKVNYIVRSLIFVYFLLKHCGKRSYSSVVCQKVSVENLAPKVAPEFFIWHQLFSFGESDGARKKMSRVNPVRLKEKPKIVVCYYTGKTDNSCQFAL